MKKKIAAGALLCLTSLMVVCMILAGTRRVRGKKEEGSLWMQEHSLFETVCLFGKEPAGRKGSLPRRRTFLFERGEGRWALFVPADLADEALVSFEYFSSLELSFKGENSKESQETILLRSGEAVRAKELTDRAGNGGAWDARALGEDGAVLEEARIILYTAQDAATLYLDTESGGMEAINSDKSVREAGQYLFYTEDGKKDASGECGIHGRGNSSWKQDKKQYSLNLSGEERVLGMESGRKFALVSNSSDSSCLRNRAAFDIAALCGLPMTPESAFVNVYFNGVYNGLYLLAKRPNARGGSVKLSDLEERNRLAAAGAYGEVTAEGTPAEVSGKEGSGKEGSEGTAFKEEASDQKEADRETAAGSIVVEEEGGLEIHAFSRQEMPDDFTGGYLLEMDGRYEDEDYWFSTQRHHFVVKYPEEIPLPEARYIASLVREAEKAFYSDDGINPDTGSSWEEYLDRDSWVKMYLLQDYFAQWDVESFSFFIYKEADDPLLYCGPAWDFDLSAGATALGKLPDIMQRSMWLRDHREGWLTRLAEHSSFREALEKTAMEEFFPLVEQYLSDGEALQAGQNPSGEGAGAPQEASGRPQSEILPHAEQGDILSLAEQAEKLASSAAMDCRRWKKENAFEESAGALRGWLSGRAAFLKDYTQNAQEYCTVTFRYGFADMDIYVRRGREIGFVPTEEYGEHLYGSFRRKYGEISGWKDENGNVLTPQTVIGEDVVCFPF